MQGTPSREPALAEGLRAALPVVLGYLPIGMAYGILASQAHLTTAEAVAMSLIVFAGSAQFIAVGMLAAGTGPWPIIVTTFLVNLRHLLMSAALSVSFRRIPRPLQALLAFWITDESFVVTTATLAGRQATVPFLVGLQVTAYLAWAASSLAGAVLGNLASGVAHLGMDYALPAMFIALLVLQVKDRGALLVAALAAAVSVLLAGLPGNANVIVATLAAATVGVFIRR